MNMEHVNKTSTETSVPSNEYMKQTTFALRQTWKIVNVGFMSSHWFLHIDCKPWLVSLDCLCFLLQASDEERLS